MKYTISINNNECCYGVYESEDEAITNALLRLEGDGFNPDNNDDDQIYNILDSYGYRIMLLRGVE